MNDYKSELYASDLKDQQLEAINNQPSEVASDGELLPAVCFSFNKVSGEYVAIKRGESGYYATTCYDDGHCIALNVMNGVTEEQRLAMDVGSMFGWDVSGADPRSSFNVDMAAQNRENGSALAA